MSGKPSCLRLLVSSLSELIRAARRRLTTLNIGVQVPSGPSAEKMRKIRQSTLFSDDQLTDTEVIEQLKQGFKLMNFQIGYFFSLRQTSKRNKKNSTRHWLCFLEDSVIVLGTSCSIRAGTIFPHTC